MSEKGSEKVAGSCLCGAVRFEVALPSRFCAHCHCGNCRRAHGAAFVTWVGFPEKQLSVVRGGQTLSRYATDTGATRSFCSRCGTTLFFAAPRWAGEIHVVRSNIDDAIDRAPQAHFYVDHGASWYTITDDLPCFGGPDGDEPQAREAAGD